MRISQCHDAAFDPWSQVVRRSIDARPWRCSDCWCGGEGLDMSAETRLRDKLRKIEALFAGAGTQGERLAAEAARERIRARLAEFGRSETPTEIQFSVP